MIFNNEYFINVPIYGSSKHLALPATIVKYDNAKFINVNSVEGKKFAINAGLAIAENNKFLNAKVNAAHKSAAVITQENKAVYIGTLGSTYSNPIFSAFDLVGMRTNVLPYDSDSYVSPPADWYNFYNYSATTIFPIGNGVFSAMGYTTSDSTGIDFYAGRSTDGGNNWDFQKHYGADISQGSYQFSPNSEMFFIGNSLCYVSSKASFESWVEGSTTYARNQILLLSTEDYLNWEIRGDLIPTIYTYISGLYSGQTFTTVGGLPFFSCSIYNATSDGTNTYIYGIGTAYFDDAPYIQYFGFKCTTNDGVNFSITGSDDIIPRHVGRDRFSAQRKLTRIARTCWYVDSSGIHQHLTSSGYPAMAYTLDGGYTWTKFAPPNDGQYTTHWEVVRDSSVFYCILRSGSSGKGEIYRTNDYGSTWTKTYTLPLTAPELQSDTPFMADDTPINRKTYTSEDNETLVIPYGMNWAHVMRYDAETSSMTRQETYIAKFPTGYISGRIISYIFQISCMGNDYW